jgi:protocatechuate 3,4-dioxygenase beta subunit
MNKLSSKSIIALITFIVALSLLATTVTISPEIFAQTNLSSMQPSANTSQDSTGPPPSSIQLPTTQQQVDAVATSQPCLETKTDRTPQQTEGPYFVDEMLNRSDIRSDPSDGSVQDGIPLRLIIHIHDFGRNGSCTPLKGAHVDIWHANSQGLYSDIQQAGTEGKKYLRGFQVTDDNGTVQFTTIYPGWYQGRTVHIHIKVRTLEGPEKSFDWTSQLYFNDSITDEVHTQDPYSHHGFPDTRNSQDGIYTGSSLDGLVQANSGTRLMLNLNKDKQGSYLGIFDVLLDSGQQQPAQ